MSLLGGFGIIGAEKMINQKAYAQMVLRIAYGYIDNYKKHVDPTADVWGMIQQVSPLTYDRMTNMGYTPASSATRKVINMWDHTFDPDEEVPEMWLMHYVEDLDALKATEPEVKYDDTKSQLNISNAINRVTGPVQDTANKFILYAAIFFALRNEWRN